MASDIRLRIGALSTTITFDATDTQVAQILRWFISDKVSPPEEGLTTAQQNQYYLDRALEEVVTMVRNEALKIRERELNHTSQVVNSQQAQQEVNLKTPA